MSQLRRMLLSNVGYRSAYYPGLTLNFCNTETDQPENSIIWLANQGGKTTLISLLFTNIEPDKRRFVQHLQKQDHHFTDYFHSTPGAVALELQTGGADLSGTTPPLIIGQCVVIQDNGSAQRVFFGFSANDKLEFNDLPFKGTNSISRINSMAEFKHWLEKARELNSTIYAGENQQDWKKWLDSMGVEHDLLAKQIDFCRSEGGISDFASFKDERTFLEQFFMLALDEKIANQAHEALRKAHQQYKDMPKLEAKRGIYTDLLAGFKEIQLVATKHQHYTKEIAYHDEQLIELLNNIQLRQKWLDFQIADVEKESDRKVVETKEKNEELKNIKNLIKRITLSLKNQKYREAEKNLEDEIEKLHSTEKRYSLLEAVDALAALQKVKIQHDEIIKTISAANHDIEPKESELKEIGSKLRLLYSTSIDKLRNQLSETEAAIRLLRNDIKTQEDNKAQLSHQIEDQKTIRDKSTQWLESYSQHYKKLFEKNRLLSLDGCNLEVLEAERYWQKQHTKKTNKLEVANIQKNDKIKEIEDNKEALSNIEKTIAIHTTELKQLQESLNKAMDERKFLEDSPVLCKLVQIASVNPDDEALLIKLDQSIGSLSNTLESIGSRIKELRTQKEWLEKDRLAKPDKNTEQALEWLTNRGIEAKYYPHYISAQNLDIDVARKLVESDPARFYGIQVNNLSKLRSTLDDINREKLGLMQPVVISEGCISIEHKHDHLVLPARNDAAYNEKAAQNLLKDINTELNNLLPEQKNIRDLYGEQKNTQENLKLYQKQYGKRWLEQQQQLIVKKELDVSENDQRKTGIQKEIGALINQAEILEGNIQDISTLVQKAKSHHDAIVEFIESFENHKTSEEKKKSEALSSIGCLNNNIIEIAQGILIFNENLKFAIDQTALFNEQIKNHEESLGNISHYNNRACDEAINLTELPRVKEEYDACLTSYNSLLNEKGLTGLQGRLEIIEVNLTEKEKDFLKYKRDFSENEIEYKKNNIYEAGYDLDSLMGKEKIKISEHTSLKGACEEVRRRAHDDLLKYKNHNQNIMELEEKILISELEERLQLTEKKQYNIEGFIQNLTNEAQSIDRQIQSHQGEKKLIQARLKSLPSDLSIDSIGETLDISSASDIDQEKILDKITKINNDKNKLLKDQRNSSARINDLFKNKIFPIVDNPEKYSLIGAISTDIKLYSDDQLISHAEIHTLTMQDALNAVESQISTNRDKLEFVNSSFNRLLDEADAALHAAFRVRIPEDIMHYSGKEILKSKLLAKDKLRDTYSEEQRRSMYLEHINDIVKKQSIDENGYKLATAFLLQAYESVLDNSKTRGRGNFLNIQIIKPHDVEVEYIPVNKMIGSGGEGLTAGLLLYLVIAKIRGEFMGKGQIGKAGSFLLLDNPFSKANKVDLIRPQTRLAKKLNIQLIFATGIEDLNAIGEFEHIIRLRKDRMDINSKRQYIEHDSEERNQSGNGLQDLDKYRIQSVDYSYRSTEIF